MVAAYYKVLASQPDFVTEARALLSTMQISKDAVEEAVRPFGLHGADEILGNEQAVAAIWTTVPRSAERLALLFARRWRFPSWSSSDVVEAVLLTHLGFSEHPADLLVPPAMVRIRSRATRDRSPTDGRVEEEIDIDPPPLTFIYRPFETSPKAARDRVDEYVREIRRDAELLLSNAEHVFKTRGYRPLHPKRRSTTHLALGARIVLRRYVRKETWDHIAMAEPLEPGMPRDGKTVQKIAALWTEELGIFTGRNDAEDPVIAGDSYLS